MKDRFKESQNIKSALMWLVLIGLLFFSVFASLSQIVFKIPVGNNPLPNWGLIALNLFSVLLLLLMRLTQLSTVIDRKGIEINFKPLGYEKIAWSEVKKVKLSKLKMMSMGRRYSKELGHVYNAGAKDALNLELKDGKKIMVSTRQPEALKVYLKQIKKL